MAEVVYEEIEPKPLPAGGNVQTLLFNVNGAREIHVTLRMQSVPEVFWSIHFGPTQNGGFGQTARGKCDENGLFCSPFPVYGPKMMIAFENRGNRDTTCEGNIYFIREVPLPEDA